MEHCLEQVVVVPRNGYVNRLQSWASADILARQFEIPLRIAWEPEVVAPAVPTELFDPGLVEETFWDRPRLDALLGTDHERWPRYLTHDRERRLILLAGHDRGEEPFMGELSSIIATLDSPTTLVLIAGGKFHLPQTQSFTRQRSLFYARLPWHTDLDRRVQAELDQHPSYVALHVRGTDRSLEAPTRRAIRTGLLALADSSAERSLFIAADSPQSRDLWRDSASALGFVPWSVSAIDHDRSKAATGRDAMLDWRLLGHSQALVYTAASSFGEEAAVATGNVTACVPLAATVLRQRVRRAASVLRAISTYPERHAWWGRSNM